MRKLLLFESHPLLSYALRHLAESLSFFQTVELCDSFDILLKQLSQDEDTVVLVDVASVELSLDKLMIISQRFERTSWLIFFDETIKEELRRLPRKEGNFSFVSPDAPLQEIETALHYQSRGEKYVSEVAKLYFRENLKQIGKKEKLTPTEIEILKAIALGKTTKQIAEERYLSTYTVGSHRKNIFRKLGVSNAYDAVKYALSSGIVQPAEYYI